MILEVVIVILVSIPSVIYAFRKIKKMKMGCCSCEQDVDENVVDNQQTEKLSLLQMLVAKFTPRRQATQQSLPTVIESTNLSV